MCKILKGIFGSSHSPSLAKVENESKFLCYILISYYFESHVVSVIVFFIDIFSNFNP